MALVWGMYILNCDSVFLFVSFLFLLLFFISQFDGLFFVFLRSFLCALRIYQLIFFELIVLLFALVIRVLVGH